MDPNERHHESERLFHELVDVEPDVRDRKLAQVEPELAREVRRLLEADRDWDENADATTPSETDPRRLVGTDVGPYEIVEFVGEGSRGTVYRARRTDGTGDVALKFMRPTGPEAVAKTEFDREVALLRSFRHEGIVGYLDSNRTAQDQPFVVTEFLDGGRLGPETPEVQASVRGTVRLLAATARAVAVLHERPLLHRDLKPSNVLLRSKQVREPVLIDLGLAHAPHDESPLDAEQTLDHGAVGTPAYMAPEQILGGSQVTVRSDVYGLGALLYHLLTGHPPHRLDVEPATDLDELSSRIRQRARRPSSVVDRELFANASRRWRDMAGDLDAIVLKAIEPEASDRYSSVPEFTADLQRWLERRPVLARPIPLPARAWRALLRHPWQSSAAAIALVLLTISTSSALESYRNAESLNASLRDYRTTDGIILDFVIDEVFGRAVPELDGPQVPVLDVLVSASDRLDRLERRPSAILGLRATLAELMRSIGELDRAGRHITGGLEVAEQVPSDDPQRIRFDTEHGIYLCKRREWDEGVALLQDTIARLDSSPDPARSHMVGALSALGYALAGKDEVAEARSTLERALGYTLESEPARLEILANLLFLKDRTEGAAATIDPLLELLDNVEVLYGQESVYYVSLEATLIAQLLELGREDEALPHALHCADVVDLVFEASRPERLSVLNNVASCFTACGDHDLSIPIREEVLATRRERYGDLDASVATAATNLSADLSRVGRTDRALETARLAERAARASLGRRPVDLAAALSAHATALAETDSLERAVELQSEAVGLLESAGPPGRERLAAARDHLQTMKADLQR